MHKKIDIHTHILPSDLPNFKDKYGYGGFIQLEHHKSCGARMMRDDGKFFREIQSNCWDPQVRMEECDRHGVGVQVLSTIPVLFSYWTKPQDGLDLSKFLNDHIAGVVERHPKRFIGLGTVPLQDVGLATKELERCMKVLGFAGVQIGTHVNGRNFDEPEFFEFFEAASELGASLFIHPWDMMASERMKKYWFPWLVGMPAEVTLAICSMIFSGLFDRLPRLRVAFAHGGGSFAGTLGRIDHGFSARPDLCAVDTKKNPRSYLGRFFVDSLTHDAEALRFLIKTFGAERIALGSDYPFPLGEEHPGNLIESMTELNADTKNRLFYGTALEWLGLSTSDHGLNL